MDYTSDETPITRLREISSLPSQVLIYKAAALVWHPLGGGMLALFYGEVRSNALYGNSEVLFWICS
jgi:hypothetical protein